MNIDLNSQNEDSSPSDSTDGKGGFKFLHLFLAFLLGGVLTAGVFWVPSFGGQGFIGARQTVTDPMSGTVGMAQRVTDQKYLNAEQYVNEAQELREEAQLLIEEVVTAVRAEAELRARSEFGVAISELAEAEDDFELAVALNEVINLVEDPALKSKLESAKSKLRQSYELEMRASESLQITQLR